MWRMRTYLAVTALIFLSFNCQELTDRDDPDILDAMSEIETVNDLENFESSRKIFGVLLKFA